MPTTSMTAMRSKIKVAVFILLFAVAFFLRIIPVITGSTHFSFDQGQDIIITKLLVTDHKLNLISRYSGLQGILMGPVWTWFLAIPFTISGGNPSANVVFIAICTLLSGFGVYWLFKKIIGETAAITAMLYVLFAPVFVSTSEVVLSPTPLIFLFFLFVFGEYQLFIKEDKRYWVVLLFLAGLFFQFEIAFAIFVVPAIAVTWLFFRKQKVFSFKFIFIGAFLFIATFLPQVLFELRHQFLMSRSLSAFFSGHNTSLYGSSSPLPLRFVQRARSFVEDYAGMAIFLKEWYLVVPEIAAILTGWLFILRRKLKNETNFLKILLAIILAFYLGFSVYPGPIWGWYRDGLPIVYTFLTAIPLAYLYKNFSKFRILLAVFGIVVLIEAVNPRQVSTTLTAKEYGSTAISTQEKVLDYVYNSSEGKPFYYYVYTPPLYDYIWQYDFWWYGERKYKRLPENFQFAVPLLGIGHDVKPPTVNQGLFYLIMEPDYDRPWASKEWRKSFIKVGKVLDTREFSGIVVEKRST